MATRVVSGDEFRSIVSKIADAAAKLGDPQLMISIIVLTGDRITCCDEAIVFDDDPQRGIAIIASEGEEQSGQSTIVGVYVRPADRRKGHGAELLSAAVRRCIARGFDNIRVDVMSRASEGTVEKLPDVLPVHLDVHRVPTGL
jgi:ribosomal protein S18 acetylase RimI-like enzyme